MDDALRLRCAFDGAAQPRLGDLYAATCGWALARQLDADWLVRWHTPSGDQTYPAALQWLGLDWDEGPDVGGRGFPSTQAQFAAARALLSALLAADGAYADPPGVVRLRLTTPGVTPIRAGRRGQLTFDNQTLAAIALTTADGTPQPVLLAALADHTAGVTHVVLTDDSADVPAFAVQSAIAQAQAWRVPTLILLPALPAEVAAQPLAQRQADGYLPQALFSQFLHYAWATAAPGDLLDKWAARTQLRFDDLRVDRPVWDESQLAQLNRAALERMPVEQVAALLRDPLEEAYGDLPGNPAWLVDLTRALRPHLTLLSDVVAAAEWAFDAVQPTVAAQTALAEPAARLILVQLLAELTRLVLLDSATAETIVNGLRARLGPQVEPVLLAALTGNIEGPALPAVLALLGKARAQERVARVLR